jgi:hypothetical protein
MNQVESVAFWCAFIASIVGTVLALVAIAFSVLVDRRSSRVSDHTIQSLQKIESAVERLSSDTRELIKAGWDKMLGGVEKSPPPDSSDPDAKQLAAGIAAELRSELTALFPDKKPDGQGPEKKDERIEAYLKELEASLMAQMRGSAESSRPSARFEDVSNTVRGLSVQAYCLLRAIRFRHLTQAQYRRLADGPLADALFELRKAGLLAPVAHRTEGGKVPCYYMPSSIAAIGRAVLDLLPEPPDDVTRPVELALNEAGYPTSRRRSASGSMRGGGTNEPHSLGRGEADGDEHAD